MWKVRNFFWERGVWKVANFSEKRVCKVKNLFEKRYGYSLSQNWRRRSVKGSLSCLNLDGTLLLQQKTQFTSQLRRLFLFYDVSGAPSACRRKVKGGSGNVSGKKITRRLSHKNRSKRPKLFIFLLLIKRSISFALVHELRLNFTFRG